MATLFGRLARLTTRHFRSTSRSQQSTFTAIFEENGWGGGESVSGPGSTQSRGADFQADLIALLDRAGVHSIVDAPCGDFNWMRNLLERRPLSYIGIDIVAPLIEANSRRYGSSGCRFLYGDMTRMQLPGADLVLCRDGLVHLSFIDARAAVRNFRRSGSRYLLASTFVDRRRNADVPTGGWRPLNLEAPPFRFPTPMALVDERCTHSGGIYRDKRLGLWNLAALDI